MKTILDVAKKAKTSSATVSHVINGTRFVSDDLKKKVLDAMKELNYKPNMMARGLKGGSTNSIGLIIPDCTNSFFAEIAREIDNCCFSKGYNIILCNTNNDVEKQTSYINMLISKKVDGVILISSDDSDDGLTKLEEALIPVVVVDRIIEHRMVDNILIDNEKGGYIATKYLLSLGYDKIGCISGPLNISSSTQRIAGYKKALKEGGIEIRDDYISPGDFHFSGGIKAYEDYAELKDKPQAIFCANDMMALGFINGLRLDGLEVPNDISIIGFDDNQLASMSIPKLTTIAQPLDKIAQSATRLILKRIENKEGKVSKLILEPVLVIRESCKKNR